MRLAGVRVFSLLPLLAAALLAWACPSVACAQSVTIFSDDFETGYTSGAALPTTGNWAAIQGDVTVQKPGTNNYAYLLKHAIAATNAFAATTTVDASGNGGQAVVLAFMLRYTSNNGNPADNKADGAIAFNEFRSGAVNQIEVEWSTDGTNYNLFHTFPNIDNARTYVAFKDVHLVIPSAALTSSMQIRFSQPSGSGGSSQWAIDDVRIMINPEPGTWTLFGLGAAGLAAAIRRRRARRRSA